MELTQTDQRRFAWILCVVDFKKLHFVSHHIKADRKCIDNE